MDTQRIEELVDLKGKAAVITGSALGIGQAIAVALADVGAAVMIADSNLDAAYETVGEISERGGYAEAMFADACSVEDAHRVMHEAVERFGTLDILVNSAATFSFNAALPQIQDLWSKTLSSYVKGVYYYSQAAAQKMIETGHGGRIINIASTDAMQSAARSQNGETSKASIAQVSKALAIEYGPYNICVNALAPGIVQPAAAQVAVASLSRSSKSLDQLGTNPDVPDPLKRFSKAEEIATVVLYLVSDAGGQITGNLVVVD